MKIINKEIILITRNILKSRGFEIVEIRMSTEKMKMLAEELGDYLVYCDGESIKTGIITSLHGIPIKIDENAKNIQYVIESAWL